MKTEKPVSHKPPAVRTTQVTVRVSESHAAALRAAADTRGLMYSEYLRAVVEFATHASMLSNVHVPEVRERLGSDAKRFEEETMREVRRSFEHAFGPTPPDLLDKLVEAARWRPAERARGLSEALDRKGILTFPVVLKPDDWTEDRWHRFIEEAADAVRLMQRERPDLHLLDTADGGVLLFEGA